MTAPTLPFDTILLAGPAGSRKLTLEELLALPLSERIGAILERRVSFFLKGKPVDTDVALRAVRASAAR